MAKATARLVLDPARVRLVVGSATTAAVARAGKRVAERARNNVTASGRVDTGKMRSSIRSSGVKGDVMTPRVEVASRLPYTIYQEAGTRAHGPVRANFLVFTPKGSNTLVFARWVRGVKPARFMQKALDSLSVADFL